MVAIRYLLCVSLLLTGCSPSDETPGGDGGGTGSGWVGGDCAALGATKLAGGGCHIKCSTSSSCPAGSVCENATYQPYCRAASCNSAADCGRQGWVCAYGACYLACATSAVGVQAPDCPTGLQCSPSASITSMPPSCTKIAPKPSCGSCKLCYQSCSTSCTGTGIPASCNTTCMAACDKCPCW